MQGDVKLDENLESLREQVGEEMPDINRCNARGLATQSALSVLLALFFLPGYAEAQANFWQQTNGPVGANVRVISGSGEGTLYAGTVYGGLYRSTDNGRYWRFVDGAPTGFRIYTALITTGTGVILASVSPGGIYRSSDGGTSWSLRATFTTTAFVVLPNGHILASGMYKSTDDGISWVPVVGGPPPGPLIVTRANTVVAAANGSGIFVSRDSANTWMRTYSADRYFSGLTAQPKGLIYACSRLSGLFLKSTDDGETWIDILPSWPDIYSPAILAADSTGSVYAGSPVYESTNDGDTWSLVSSLAERSVLSFLFFPSEGFAVAGSIYRRDGEDTTWSQSDSGFINTQIISMTALDDSVVLAGDGAIFRSTDRGGTWSVRSTVNGGRVLSLGYADSGFVWAAVRDVGIYESGDYGLTWTLLEGTPNPNADMTIMGDGTILVANWYANGGIFRSSNRGATWEHVYGPSSVWSLSNEQNGFLFAGADDAIIRSADGGLTWRTALTIRMARAITCTPRGLVVAGTSSGDVYTSSNYGVIGSWRYASAGMGSVYALESNSLGHIFAGTDGWGGVFRSTDDGWSWAPWTPGLTVGTIASFAVTPTGYLYAGSIGAGVFRTAEPTTDVQQGIDTVPQDFVLFQNYPNPFNPRTTIRFQIPAAAFVRLSVFDLLGREVAILVNEHMEPGTYQKIFNSDGIGSGIYFYRLSAGGFTATRKALIIK